MTTVWQWPFPPPRWPGGAARDIAATVARHVALAERARIDAVGKTFRLEVAAGVPAAAVVRRRSSPAELSSRLAAVRRVALAAERAGNRRG